MGNISGGNKGSTSGSNTGAPAWSRGIAHAGTTPGQSAGPTGGDKYVTRRPGGGTLQPGTDAYKNANTQLQTGPIQAANEVIGNRGLGQTSQNVINNVMGGGGANNWMNQAASVFQNLGQIGTGQFNQIYNNAQNVGQVGTGNLERFMGQAGNVGRIGTGSFDPLMQKSQNIGQVGQQNYQGVYDRAGQQGAADQYLTSTAQGQNLGGSPYLDDIVAKSSQGVADQTNQMFAAGGRYGSGAHQGTVADAVASNANNLRNQNYQQERDRQMQAAGTLENAQQGRLGIQSGAAGGVANVQNQNIGNQMQSAQLGSNIANQVAGIQDRNINNQMQGTQLGANIANQIAGVQNQNIGNWLQAQNLGLGAAQGAANAQGQNINNQLNAAGQLGGLGQQAMTNQFNAANLENQGMGNMLGMIGQLSGIQNNKVFDANQQMGLGGKIDERTQQGLNDLINQWNQADMAPWARLGGLLSVGTGSAGNWGTQTSTQTQPANFGGILAALLGAIPKASDRRLKEDIRRVGRLDNGLPVYAYRYRGQATTEIGLMADEVAKLRPDAVVDGRSGFKAVHYDLAVM